MKVYLAAPYALRDKLREYAEDLRSCRHECTSSWLIDDHPITPKSLGTAPGADDDYATKHVRMDIHDVLRSDVLVVITWDKAVSIHGRPQEMGPNSGGRHVETGIALGAKIPVIVFGPPENIFHRGLGVRRATDWEDVLDIIITLPRRHAFIP